MSNKTIPYSIEAEESLLGNIILYKEAMRESIDAGLTPNDFYLQKHHSIYSIMSAMYENHESIDAVSLSSKLKDFSLIDKIGGNEYIAHLASTTISATNTREYINIIRNKSLARRLIKVGEEISNDALDAKVGIDEMLENVEKKVVDITHSKTSADFVEGDVLFEQTLKHVEKLSQLKNNITGVRTLYKDLDYKTAGFQKGDLIILAARPSMGKTALALNFAVNAASVNHGSIALFSLEMPSEQVAIRMLAAKAKVDISKIRVGNLNDEEWSRINVASQELRKQNFFVDDTPGIKVTDIMAKCRKLVRDNNLYMVIIDYIQLIQSTGTSESRQLEVSEISRRLKAMARELNVPVIALSQLSRSVEKRENRKPMLSDLRESGAIEQDADLVMFLYREKYYDHEKENDNNREDVDLILAKHRNGPTGELKLAFEKSVNAFTGISNLSEEN